MVPLLSVALVLALAGGVVLIFAPTGIDTDLRGFGVFIRLFAGLFGVFGGVEWFRRRNSVKRSY